MINEKINRGSLSFLHPNVSLIVKTFFMNVVLFSVFRALFFVRYHAFFEGIEPHQTWFSALHGLRFDFSTIFQLYSVFFLVLLLPGKWVVSKISNTVYRIIVTALLILEALVLAIDIEYYGFVRRHLALDIINIKDDIVSMVGIVISSYFIQLILVCFLFVLMWFIVKRFLKQDKQASPSASSSALNIFIFIVISVIFWRGGLQHKPLRVSYAFTNDKVVLGHLSLNGIYTMFQAIYKSGVNLHIDYDYNSAVKNVQRLIVDGTSSFMGQEYPLLRKMRGNGKKEKLPNVVIFIMESWSGDCVGALGSDMGLTPSFDALAEKGRLFTNCFSVGQRSLDAVVSVLYSFPSFTNCTMVGKVYEQNNMIGIGNILKKHGYSTLFICGAKRGSMGFDAFASKIGFDRYIAEDDFHLPKEAYDSAWGVFDEHSFLRADEEFRKTNKPFLAVLYTLNPHAPYPVPSDKFKIKTGENAAFYNALHYSDWSLGRFFKKAQDSEYFKNTLFIILADHCEGHHEKTVIDSFRIPCLFYFPGKLEPYKDSLTASQLDILPSILDFIGIDCVHASMGKSLFREAKRYAMISYGNIPGWIQGDDILLHSIDKPIGLFNWQKDRMQKNNILSENKAAGKEYEDNLLSVLKVTEHILKYNKAAPLEPSENNGGGR